MSLKILLARALETAIFVLFAFSLGHAVAQNQSASGSTSTTQPATTQPAVIKVFPERNTIVPDGAAFALKLAEPLKSTPRALCDVQGVRSAIPTEVITGTKRDGVLRAYGIPTSEHAANAQSPWVVLRCQTSFPDAAFISLRWLDPKPSTDPKVNSELAEPISWNGQYFNYSVRSDWPLSVECERSNASVGCNPLSPITLRFTKEVRWEDLITIRLKAENGKVFGPSKALLASPPVNQQGFTTELVIEGLPAEQTLTLEMPVPLRLASGQDLIAATRGKAPRKVHIGAYPPLVKFASTFGIVEKNIGGIVPLTVRSVGPAQPVKLRSLRVLDEAAMIEATMMLRRVTSSDDMKASRGEGEFEFEESGEPLEPSTGTPTANKKAVKLRYPFVQADASDSRSSSWLKSFKETRTQDLARELQSAAFEVVGIPLTEPGLYLLEAESISLGRGLLGANKPMFVRSGALVTDMAVHLHFAEGTAGVWVTQLSSGKPVEGADIGLFSCDGKRIGRSTSNAQGWVQIDIKARANSWGCPLFAFAKKAGDTSFVRSDWQRGIELWRFEGLGYNFGSGEVRRVVHTALGRNLLRAGDTLYAKHYWRAQDNKGNLSAPKRQELPASASIIHVGSGDRVTVPMAWDDRGNSQTVYKVPEGARRGSYAIEFSGYSSNFRVEDFRLPALKAEVSGPATPQIAGRPIVTTARLSYLSGGPAAGESVQIYQRLAAHTPSFADYADYAFGVNARDRYSSDDEADALESAKDASKEKIEGAEDKTVKLDANGQTTVNAIVNKKLSRPRALVTDMEYRDPNGETYRAQGKTVVWPSAVVIGAKAEYWASGKERKVEFVVLDIAGKPAVNVPLNVSGAFEGWTSHRRKTVGGFYAYKYDERRDPLKPLCNLRTDRQGKAVCRFNPNFEAGEDGQIESGNFAIEATASDSVSRVVKIKTSMYVYQGGEVWFEQADHDRMDVLVEKPRYKPGETATIQIRSPFKEATALVSVMRGAGIVETLVIPLSGTNPTIQLPIKPSYAPNVFLNVLAVRGRVAEPAATALIDLARPAFKLGIAELEVRSDVNELKVKVSTDKAVYQSREIAKASIEVVPHPSKPFTGDQEVTVFALDEALLELLPNSTWNVVKAMLDKRGYGFQTASAAMQVVGRRHYGRKALPAGGGGGRSGARELFDTLLLWRGTIKLDASGKAIIPITVNDSLTRFRVVVIANAGVEQFGTGEASFNATKDLQVRSGLPVIVREGDKYSAGVTVRNSTKEAFTVIAKGSVKALGTNVPTFALNESLAPQTIQLAGGEAKQVIWQVTSPVNSDSLEWRIDVSERGGRNDEIAFTQSVSTPLTAQRFAVAGQVVRQSAEPSLITARLPADVTASAVQGKGDIRVSLTPAVATDATGIRKYMSSYPFYCLEQRTSKAVSLKDEKLWAMIAGTITQYMDPTGLVNYYPNQRGYAEGYDVLTAFVMSAAHEANFKLPKEAEQKMLQGLTLFVQGKVNREFSYYSTDGYDLTHRKLLALEAIARYQPLKQELVESLKIDPARDLPKLSNRAVVQWLDVLNRVDWPNVVALRDAAVAEFDKRLATNSAGAMQFISAGQSRWYFMDNDSVTLVRAALLAVDTPALSSKATGLALGAMASGQMQRQGAWWDTQANVWGSLMLDKRAAKAATAVSGLTSIALGNTAFVHDWSKQPKGGDYTFALAPNPATPSVAIAVLHKGNGEPFVSGFGTLWVDVKTARQENASITRTVKPVRQQKPGQWTAGDIVEVQLKFGVTSSSGWYALTDPIPPGASVLGSGLKGMDAVEQPDRNSFKNSDGSYETQPSYVERSFGFVRAYYEYLWGTSNTLTYQLRVNTPGVFKLPATQFEAMYDPTIAATLPNPSFEVKAQ